MSRADSHIINQNLFGEQFAFLAEALADPEPARRANALAMLEIYLEDCMKPIRALQLEVGRAASQTRATKASLEAVEKPAHSQRSPSSGFATASRRQRQDYARSFVAGE